MKSDVEYVEASKILMRQDGVARLLKQNNELRSVIAEMIYIQNNEKTSFTYKHEEAWKERAMHVLASAIPEIALN